MWSDLSGLVNLRALLNVAPVLNSATFPGAPIQHGYGIGKDQRSSEPQMLIGRDYDHNFILRHARPGSLDLAVRLYDPVGGRQLDLSTTEPGVQVYSSNNLNGGMVSAAGTTLRAGDGMALETEHFPDSPNHPSFPTTELRPGQTFTSTTQLHFSVR